MSDLDPIEISNKLKSALANINSPTNSEILNTQNQIYNINNEILVKQDQLDKIKNDELEGQLDNIKSIENSIINKDRLIEQVQFNINNNNENINILYIGILFSIILMGIVCLYALGKINDKLFGILVVLIILFFIIMIMYKYNIFYFKTVTHFVDNRKNLAILNSVKDLGSQVKSNMQERLYGSKQDFLDDNCDCPPSQEDVYNEEEGASVNVVPGYFYYDNSAPKQLLVPNGGDKIDVSTDIGTEEIFDKIDWVNHDKVMYDTNSEESGHYQMNPNSDKLNTNNKLVNDSTYTVNL
jgi:hypothetical protein